MQLYELDQVFLDIAQDRYVRGEISKQEFAQKRQVIWRHHQIDEVINFN